MAEVRKKQEQILKLEPANELLFKGNIQCCNLLISCVFTLHSITNNLAVSVTQFRYQDSLVVRFLPIDLIFSSLNPPSA